MTSAFLQIREIRKSFGGVPALDQVDFDLSRGEIHGLLGGNGAGKTTLMNVLYGLYRADAGDILLGGNKIEIRAPRDAIRHGIGMVHQHFLQIESFSVAENVILGTRDNHPLQLDLKRSAERIKILAQKFGVKVEPRAEIAGLSLGARQKIEILKALYRGAQILILDEPTSSLAPQEVDSLFQLLKGMVREGVSIVFITHKIREVLDVCNRVTVLRDGKNILTLENSAANEEQLVGAMVGGQMDLEKSLIFSKGATLYASEVGPSIVLQARDLRVEERGVPRVKNCSFEIREKEIFGIAGVAGNGQRELAESIVGIRLIVQGSISFLGTRIERLATWQRLESGIAYIPEDRLQDGFLPAAEVAHNLILGAHRQSPYRAGRFLDWKSIYDASHQMIAEYNIRTSGPHDLGGNLSGGNIQRVMIARAFARNAPLLIAHNPTRGLDLPSTEFVYTKMLERKKTGAATLLISEDLDELLLLCDRIGVIYRGEVVGVVERRAFDKYRIGKLMGGVQVN